MDSSTDSITDFEQCLSDIGCDKKTAEEFKSSDPLKRIRLLKKHRRALMQNVRENQKKVDWVDYIISRLESD